MRVLVLGGSVFVGRAVVTAAQARGAQVTVFNRGRSAPAPSGARQLTGDRTREADLAQLRADEYDLVVDTSGYVPAEVGRGAELLADRAGHYVFVSSINVYPGWPAEPDYRTGGVHDGDPDADRAAAPDPESAYGWLKAGAERAVRRAFGDGRCSILRAGVIVGPHDSRTGRLPWWLDRVARGGEVLVPGRPADPVALLDARDLAGFALGAGPGTFEVSGPDGVTRADLMAACRAVTGSSAELHYVPDEAWLLDQGVQPWSELPLWGPRATMPSTFRHHSGAAVEAGLRWRPLTETVADTWAWQRSIPGGWRPAEQTPGLDPARERELLLQGR